MRRKKGQYRKRQRYGNTAEKDDWRLLITSCILLLIILFITAITLA